MTHDERFIGHLEDYLDEYEGNTPLPDAIREAIRAELPRTKQVARPGRLSRYTTMKRNSSGSVRYGLAAAAVLAAVVFGAAILGQNNFGAPSGPSAISSPTASPKPAVTATTVFTDVAPANAVTIHMSAHSAAFDPVHITVAADAAIFFVVNEGPVTTGMPVPATHSLAIGLMAPTAMAHSDRIGPGESAVVTVTGLVPGEYQFWCGVNQHYTEFPSGTLTVTP